MVNRDARFSQLSNKMAIPSEQQYYLKMERITWPSLGGSRPCKVTWTGNLSWPELDGPPIAVWSESDCESRIHWFEPGLDHILS